MRTPRGRIATPAAYEHMRMTPPAPGALETQIRMALDNENE